MNKTGIFRASAVTFVSVAALVVGSNAFAASDKGTVSVLNWWTSGSEAKSMKVLQQMLDKQGYKMVNDAVSGGGGSNARTVLKSRIQSNNLPGYAQIKGPEIQQWCEAGVVGSIDSVAQSDDWSKLLPGPIAKGMQCDGKWVAVPFNIHRINWLWLNQAALEKADASVPKSWDDLVTTLGKLKKAGITPIAGGGDTWQIATEFDAIAMATGGADFYRKAFVDLDSSALSGSMMQKSFKRLRTIQKYSDPNGTGLSWNQDTGMVVNGKAGMQIMGDWAKGEITNAGATPGKEIACTAFPGEHSGFIYNADSFEIFDKSKSDKTAETAFARTALSPDFQRQFNMAKGSIPVREGVSLKGFDQCAHTAEDDFKKAESDQALVPSFSQDMAETGAVKGAIFDVIAKFYNDSNMTPEQAAQQLSQQVEQAKMMSQM